MTDVDGHGVATPVRRPRYGISLSQAIFDYDLGLCPRLRPELAQSTSPHYSKDCIPQVARNVDLIDKRRPKIE